MGKREIKHINLVGGASAKPAIKSKKRKMIPKARSRDYGTNLTKSRGRARNPR